MHDWGPDLSEEVVAEIDPLFRAWLLRHELPDAYSRWQNAEGARAPLFAFTAVACDGRLVNRLGSGATFLAAQAERFAEDVAAKREASAEARATAQIVRVRIQTWRQRSASKPAPPEIRLSKTPPKAAAAEPVSEPKPLTLDDHLRIALQDHPHYRESTARALFRETLRLGAAGLLVVGAPFDDAIMLATSRYAGRAWRGVIRGEAPSREEIMTAVALVQQWGVRSGKNPFNIDFSSLGAPDDLVVALCRDVGTCLAIASRFSGGALAPGFAMWEEAEEYLCYAVLSIRPTQLSQMSLEQARSFAAAAARLAASAVEHDGIRLPSFGASVEAGSPRRVLATTRFALPNGVDARRSALVAAKPPAAPVDVVRS